MIPDIVKGWIKQLVDILTAAQNGTSPLNVTGGGGGTEYTEGATDASITGSAIMWEDTGDTIRTVSAASPLPVTATLDTTGLATSAKQDDIITAIGAIPGGGGVQYTEGDTDASITGTASLVEGAANALAVMTQPLTDTQLRASDVKITLDGESVPVTGTFWQATQPVSGTVAVTATNLDIRDLTNTDVVTAELSAVDNAVLDTIAAKDFATQTTLSAINTKLVSGTDIGDVTINNAAGVAAVNIQDGGNSITVDGTVTANLAAGTNNIGDVDILSIAAGDNNIGNVDIVTLPNITIGSALPSGTNAIGKLAANSGVDIGDVDVTSISAGTNLIGDVGVQPRTTNGLDTFMASGSDGSTALTSTAQAVKASAGKVYGYYIYNPNSSAQFVHFYNTASGSVTVGTTNPLFTLTIPATSAANLGITDMGVTFGTAISISATATAGGNGAPSTALDAVVWYK